MPMAPKRKQRRNNMAERPDQSKASIIAEGRPGIGANMGTPRHWRIRGFATTDRLPKPVLASVVPYAEDSSEFHSVLLSGEHSDTFLGLPTDVQAKLLWLGDQCVAVAVDGGANRKEAITHVSLFMGRIASIIPLEGQRG